ncbi:unnamed protein product [Closterium sp. Naga37s-1]|nr:unnamed protein product [Closterium sp. Naga37s-1]
MPLAIPPLSLSYPCYPSSCHPLPLSYLLLPCPLLPSGGYSSGISACGADDIAGVPGGGGGLPGGEEHWGMPCAVLRDIGWCTVVGRGWRSVVGHGGAVCATLGHRAVVEQGPDSINAGAHVYSRLCLLCRHSTIALSSPLFPSPPSLQGWQGPTASVQGHMFIVDFACCAAIQPLPSPPLSSPLPASPPSLQGWQGPTTS